MRRQGPDSARGKLIPESDYPRSGFYRLAKLWVTAGDRLGPAVSARAGGEGMMFGFWHRRKNQRNRIRQEAEALITKHGDAAYELARSCRIAAFQQNDPAEHRFWCAVARVVADRTGREIGVDTATRYTNASDERGRFRTDDGETTRNQ